MSRKNILLAVTGSIAAYKACDIVRRLQDQEHTVSVIMTSCAQQFVTPLTFEALTGRPVYSDMFARDARGDMQHIALAKWATAFLIAPATANMIGRLAAGLADDLVTCTALTFRGPLFIAPAMNTGMFMHPAVQQNMARLTALGYNIIPPGEGRLACGDTGAGALAGTDRIVQAIDAA